MSSATLRGHMGATAPWGQGTATLLHSCCHLGVFWHWPQELDALAVLVLLSSAVPQSLSESLGMSRVLSGLSASALGCSHITRSDTGPVQGQARTQQLMCSDLFTLPAEMEVPAQLL